MRAILCLLLCWLCLGPVFAENESPFKTIQLDISIFDKFQRPYVAQPESAMLGIRLAQGESQQCKAVAQYEQLASAGVEYPKQTDEYLKFPVENGIAKAQFVIFTDTSKNPIDYEMVLFYKENKEQSPTKIALNPSTWHIGVESQSGDVAADHRAPHSKDELAMIVGFAVGGALLSYIFFGRLFFTRLLQNSRLEVSTALGWSNIGVLFSWLLLFSCVAALVFIPYVVWQKTYWIYLLVIGGYGLLMILVYGLSLGFTRR